MAANQTPLPVKIHLILNGYQMCDTPRRDGGAQATTDATLFARLDDGCRCKKCATKYQKLWAQTRRSFLRGQRGR